MNPAALHRRGLRTGALFAAIAVAVAAAACDPPTATPAPSPTAAAVAPSPSPRLAPYPTDQPGHPELGGASWKIIELAGKPETGFAYLEIWGGKGKGSADGLAEGNCWAIGLRYSYDPSGPGLIFDVSPEGDGRYAESCSPQELATYAAVGDVLQRVTAWRLPRPDRLELLDVGGSIVLVGEPPPPLPPPPPGGDCGEIPLETCIEAATAAFNFGVFPEPGQTVVSWKVRPTKYTSCASGFPPLYDVTLVLANPAYEKVATVGMLFDRLAACGDY